MDMVAGSRIVTECDAEDLRAALEHAIRLADALGEALIAVHIQMALDKLREGELGAD